MLQPAKFNYEGGYRSFAAQSINVRSTVYSRSVLVAGKLLIGWIGSTRVRVRNRHPNGQDSDH